MRSTIAASLTTSLIVSCVLLAHGRTSADEPAPRQAGATLEVPPSNQPLHLSVPWPDSSEADRGTNMSSALRKTGEVQLSALADRVPDINPDGSLAEDTWRLVTTILPEKGNSPRRFEIAALPRELAVSSAFRISAVDEGALGVWEGDRPVLVYNHGFRSKEGVPSSYDRSSYVHPIYGLDGEVLTDDFPEDHYHHRGLFWTWPHVSIDGRHYDLWLGGRGIEQRFERWLAREAGHAAAVLGVENGWYVGDRKVMEERIWLTVYPATGDEQAIDVACYWTPLDRPITLAGAEGKSYGGLTLRFAPRTGTTITTPQGSQGDDLLITRLPWADLTAQFADAPGPSGAAIFIGQDHPDFPPEWLTRHYGVLCVGWPGVNSQTLEPGKTVNCRYRIWIHRRAAGVDRIDSVFAAFNASSQVRWEPTPTTVPHGQD